MTVAFCVNINTIEVLIMTEEYLSQRAFAQLPEVGVSNVRINKLVKEGRIPTVDGKIPKTAGISAWQTCRVNGFENAAKGGHKGGRNARKNKANESMRDDGDEDASDPVWGPRFNKAKALEKEAMAKKREFELEVDKGNYVHIDEIKAEASDLAATLRQKIFSLAPIIATQAEGKNANQIERIVEIELNEALKELQNMGE